MFRVRVIGLCVILSVALVGCNTSGQTSSTETRVTPSAGSPDTGPSGLSSSLALPVRTASVSSPATSALPGSNTKDAAVTPSTTPGRKDPLPAPTTRAPKPSAAVTTARSLLTGPGPAGKPLTLTGTVEEGVERGCLVMTDRATGKVYNLRGGGSSLVRAGAMLRLTGVTRTDLVSYCQQGAIFQVRTAELL